MVQQVAIQDKEFNEIRWDKVAVAGVSGAVSAIPGLGWVGAGLISGATSATMTALDGGTWQECLLQGGIGFATGAAANKIASSIRGNCFAEGTLVLTAAGAVAIETITVGTLVYAYDEETGDIALKEVVRLFRGETLEWHHIMVNGEEIVCTPEHPFFVLNATADTPVIKFKGFESKEGKSIGCWIAAKDLKVGDIVLLSSGKTAIIEETWIEMLEKPAITYNFEVEGFHTYYVGENGVLVHNACQTPDQKALTRIIKENGKSNPLSMTDANTLVGWGKEVGMDIRIDLGHEVGSAVSRAPHLHTGFNSWHIPIIRP